MKKALVLGITLVILLVSVIAYTNVTTTNEIPDDQALMDWYVVDMYGSGHSVSILDHYTYTDGLESNDEDDNKYIHYDVFDKAGNRTGFGSVLKSYLICEYERNN